MQANGYMSKLSVITILQQSKVASKQTKQERCRCWHVYALVEGDQAGVETRDTGRLSRLDIGPQSREFCIILNVVVKVVEDIEVGVEDVALGLASHQSQEPRTREGVVEVLSKPHGSVPTCKLIRGCR